MIGDEDRRAPSRHVAHAARIDAPVFLVEQLKDRQQALAELRIEAELVLCMRTPAPARHFRSERRLARSTAARRRRTDARGGGACALGRRVVGVVQHVFRRKRHAP